MKTILRLFALPLCLAVVTPGIRADDALAAPADNGTAGTPTLLKFSDPAKPGTVKIKIMWGDVSVTGADAPEVTILANVKNKSSPERRPDGLRRLDSEVTYTASEKDNVITVELGGDTPHAGAGARVALTVPRTTSVVVQNSFGGSATVKEVTGDLEIHSLNGAVTLERINGSALVETMNGEIHASFTQIATGKPLSFTSMNGEIEVQVPADTKANVRLRTQNGAVYTDFDEKALVTKTEAVRGHVRRGHRVVVHVGDSSDSGDESDWHDQVRDAVRDAARVGAEAAREAIEAAHEAAEAAREGVAEARDNSEVAPVPPVPPVPPMPPAMPTLSGGKVVSGTLNGGGPEIQIATMNGTITLRKTQP
jgi:hypothetical protein